MAGQWFYAASGGQAGPVDAAELRRLADEGALQPTDLVWREGMPEWVPANKVKGLFPAADNLSPTTPADPGKAPAAAPAGEWPAPGPEQSPPAAGYDPSPAAVIPYQGGGVPVGVSARTMDLLRQTRPWVLFLSILGFILAGLMVLVGVGLSGVGLMARGGGMPGWIGLVYIVMAALYFFPALYLWRYGSRIGSLVARGQLEDLEGAIEAQKTFWRLSGIIVIAGIVLYFVAIAVVLLVSMP